MLPAGHAAHVRFHEDGWSLRVAPQAPAASTLADGPAECLVDQPGRGSGDAIEPAYGALAPNGYVGGNTVRSGTCPPTTFTGPVTFLTFNTAGNAGGYVLLEGWDPLTTQRGWFRIWCWPAGTATGAGAMGEWQTSVQFQDAHCLLTHSGPQPSAYVEWSGTVANHNTGPSQSTYALAY